MFRIISNSNQPFSVRLGKGRSLHLGPNDVGQVIDDSDAKSVGIKALVRTRKIRLQHVADEKPKTELKHHVSDASARVRDE